MRPKWGRVAVKNLGVVRVVTSAVLLWLVCGCFAEAQLFPGRITGVVRDAQGAVVAGATVKLTNPSTGQERTIVSDATGEFNFPQLPLGSFQLTVTKEGFRTTIISDIATAQGQVNNVDPVLAIGTVSSQIEVSSSSGLIQTETNEVGGQLNQVQVQALPIGNSDYTRLALVLPGVTQNSNFAFAQYTINGSRARSNGFNIDGVSDTDPSTYLPSINEGGNSATAATRLPLDAIQEVTVSASAGADSGQNSGSVMNVIVRSGTNQIHGSLFEFLNNQVLNARTYFTLPTPANPTAAKPPLRQNQFGVEIDGPVVIPRLYNGRDKTFFMASYGGYRLDQSATSLSTSMPAVFFNGNFSGVPTTSITHGALVDPLNGNTPFPGNIIPTSRVSPVALKLQAYYPATDLPGFASNYSVPVPTTIFTNQTVDRIDQNIGDKIRLYARADDQYENVFGGSAIPTNAATTPVDISNYTVGYTHTITPNLVNDLRVGRNFFSTATLDPFSVAANKNAGTALGIPGFNGDSTYNNPGIPDFNITGFNGLNNASTNWYQNDSTTQLSEQVSWNHHSHNIQAGLEFRRLATGRAAVNSARGAFTFNGTLTGYAPADFILGIPQSFTTPGPEVRGRTAEWRDGFFVTDKWQVTRKLTVDYGIRYELPTVAYTINGVATELNPNQTALVGGTPGYHFTAPNHSDWAPRLGAAYRITEKQQRSNRLSDSERIGLVRGWQSPSKIG